MHIQIVSYTLINIKVAPSSTKNSIISSLTRRAYTICSPKHLKHELEFLKQTLLCNGYPISRISLIMQRTKQSLRKKKKPSSKTTPTSNIVIPYPAGRSKALKRALLRYDITTSFSSPPTLMTLLNTNKKPGPKQNTCNTIYKIPCKDCDDYYIGQTCRPLIKRVKEHEASCHLNNYIDSIGNIKSAPAKHSHDNQHTIDWCNTTILTVAQSRQQLNLLEHAAITCYNPPMNRQHKGPRISQLWNRLLPRLTDDFKPTPANLQL